MIIHGTRRTEQYLGWVADFCPICREARAFRLFRIGIVSHIYFISFGSGTLVGFEIECSDCRTRLGIDEFRHAKTEKDRPADLVDLAARTLPGMRELLGDRLRLELQIRSAPRALDPSVRQVLLNEPFKILNPQLEARAEQTHLDKPAVLGCVGTLLLVVLGVAAIPSLPPEWDDAAGCSLMVLIVLGIIYTLAQLVMINRRYHRRIILPKLARALRPLQPDREELEAIISRCRERKMQIGKKTSIGDLWQCLHPLRS
ncbi:MAG: hypothetical protein QOE70_4604 [Chthoniobacter sp.]|jgi:hypothetical protein|nr:hypothetical protein [Chthoniobacter sp.]